MTVMVLMVVVVVVMVVVFMNEGDSDDGGDDVWDVDVVLREPGNPLLVSIVYYCRYFPRALPTFTITAMILF